MGVWSSQSASLTAVGFVADLSFLPFAKLARGEYGSAPTRPGHTLLLLNPRLTTAANIGQPWDRGLRREARALLDEGGWRYIYAARALAQPDGTHIGTLVSTCTDAAGEQGGDAAPAGDAAGGGAEGDSAARLCTSVCSVEGELVSCELTPATDLRAPFGRYCLAAARAALASRR